MAAIHTIVISCSADSSELDIRNLYTWGELDSARWLPDTKREAGRRIVLCRKRNQCATCDAEIHLIKIERTKEITSNIRKIS